MKTSTPQAESERQEANEATVNRVSRAWGDLSGLIGLKQTHPALNANLEAAQKLVDDVWLACRQDLMGMTEFKAALDAWETANYVAIKAVREGK